MVAPNGENSAIWQVQSSASNGTQAVATNSNTVWFNATTVQSAGGHIFNTEFNIRNSIAENTQVDGDGNEIQDMGLDGVEVTITGMIKDSDGTNAEIDKLMTWMNQPKTLTADYTQGRFGLQLDDFPAFNMVPTKTTNIYGYVIQNLRFVRTGEPMNKTGFVLTLRVGGDVPNWFASNNFS